MATPGPGGPAATAGGAGGTAGGFNFKEVLQQLVQRNASDLHLKVGRPPTLRVNGELVSLEQPPLKPEDLKGLAEQLMTPRQVKEFTDNKECDFAIGVPGIGRFRCNVYQQRGSLCYAMRSIPYQAKTLRELNLPPVLEQIALKPRGLILVTGITGSGKSTALAAMIQHINEHRKANVITIEDPIEFLHRDINCNINQREVGTDTATFGQALRRVLRQDPDVILIGEIRDLETLDTALKAADTDTWCSAPCTPRTRRRRSRACCRSIRRTSRPKCGTRSRARSRRSCRCASSRASTSRAVFPPARC
jgi:twitching motility protein PilT